MEKSLAVASLVSAFIANGALADLLYSESFESYSTASGYYVDEQGGDSDHWLWNMADGHTVNGDGFNAYYMNTSTGTGLSDGDYFGVTNYSGTVGSWFDGDQGYQMSDVDGTVELHFDGYEGIADLITLSIFVQDTNFESTSPNVDFLSFHYGDDDTLAYYGELDLEAMGDGGSWITLEFTPETSGHFHIAFSSNSGTESVFIDAVNIYGTPIPAPGAFALLGLAGLASRRRRK
jgi:MYXO-CTERM domain-containing protein